MNDKPQYKKLGEILQNLPKEKLSGDFDERFWKRFESEKELPLARHPLAGLLMVVMAFALIFVLAKIFYLDKPSAEIAQGQVYVQPNAQSPFSALPPKRLMARGERLKTGESGWAILKLENGYQIKLEPNSEILFKELKPAFLPGKTVLYLSRGRTLVSIGGPNHIRYPLEVVTPNAFARAMGTQFMVSAPSPQNLASKISVLKGVVQVSQVLLDQKPVQGRSIPVKAGEELSISENSQDLTVAQMAESAKAELEELFQFSRVNQAVLLISMGPNRFRELLKPCVIYIRIQSDTENIKRIASIAQDIATAVDSKDKTKQLVAVERLEEASEKQTALSPAPLLLFTGAYYASLEEYSDAVRVFGNVSLKYPHSQYASLALMAEAFLQKEKLANPLKAKILALEILARYPRSHESQAAKSLLDENPQL